jgi:hypothetical protein
LGCGPMRLRVCIRDEEARGREHERVTATGLVFFCVSDACLAASNRLLSRRSIKERNGPNALAPMH